MTAPERPYNFSAGPAILPPEVTERAADAVRELRGEAHAPKGRGTGLSLIEVSHRGKPFMAINDRAHTLAREVLRIPDTHDIVLLQGGASLQFVMVPMNLGRPGKVNCYVDSGEWASKAIRESKVLGETRVLASSKDTNYDRIPAFPSIPSDAAYLHITTNNTVFGTEYPEIPDAGAVPLVVDASSHIGSRPLDFGRVALGYAGAQKNLGPSGVTLVFLHKDLVAESAKLNHLPHFLRYETHASKESMYNTPNTFGVLVLQLVLEWMRDLGGLEALEQRNRAKAKVLYDFLASSSLYTAHAQPGHGSLMNVCFHLGGAPEAEREALTKRFVVESTAAGFSGLEGHRSVGGLRASMYNAFPIAGVQALTSFMAEFERKS